jgi:hypothetical protein
MDNEPTLEIDKFGDKRWRLPNGKQHRVDGPAAEWADGTKLWYRHGKSHREDGPSDEWANGDKEWYLNGDRHRIDGPAVEGTDGYRSWYLDGYSYELDDWLELNIYISEEEKVMIKLTYG